MIKSNKHILLFVLLSVLCGCGHNRFNEYKSTGVTVAIPFGDMGALGIGVGSVEYTTAMVRGGSSFTTETAAGGGIFSGAAGSSRITTFRSNTQLNEKNLMAVLTETNIPESVKCHIAEGLSCNMTAPTLAPSVLQTREAVIYGNGATNKVSYPFNPTGVDKLSEEVSDLIRDAIEDVTSSSKDIINNAVDKTQEVVDKVTDSVDNSVNSAVDATANMTRAQAIGALCLALMVALAIFVKTFRKKYGGTPPPDQVASTNDIEVPPIEPDNTDIDSPSEDSPTEDIPDDVPIPEESEEDTPEVKKGKLESFLDSAIAVVDFWNKLPKSKKKLLKDSVKVATAPKKKD